MNKELLKEKVCRIIDEHREVICGIGNQIYRNPELGYKEFNTSQLVIQTMKKYGYSCRSELAMTGVKAMLKEEHQGPNICILGELDSVVCPDHPDADADTGAAHCCGHFAQIASMLGCAIAFSYIKDEIDTGNVTFMAVPAEEAVELEYRQQLMKEKKISYIGGKQELIHLGEFDDVDLAMMIHANPNGSAIIGGANSVGFISKTVKITGKEAHAGVAPWLGKNALDAASLSLMAINSIRSTLKDSDCIRIHPIVTKGGTLVNIVPDDVRMEMYIRGAAIEGIVDANKKVNRAIQGCCYALDCEVEINDMPGYLPVHADRNLCDVFLENAKVFQPHYEVMYSTEVTGGASDLGDLMTLIPCIEGKLVGGFANDVHTKDFRLDDEEVAYLVPAKIMACTVIDLLADDARKANEIISKFEFKFRKDEYDEIWKNILQK